MLALLDGAAELVFRVISERNERASLISRPLPFSEWTKVFPDACLARGRRGPRITHRAHTIDPARSWRFNHGLSRPRRTV